MTTRALLIDNAVAAKLRTAHEFARKNPIPYDVLKAHIVPQQNVDTIKLDNRAPGMGPNDRPPSYCVTVPVGYRVAISYEQQPAGLCAHFSFSVEDAPYGMLPSVEAVEMLLSILGFDITTAAVAPWQEEYLLDGKLGGLAVNLLFLVNPAVIVVP